MFSRVLCVLASLLLASPAAAQTASWIVKDRSLSTPPGSPVNGDRYIVGPSPTGAWAGHANDIAVRSSGTWKFITATTGLAAWIDDEPAKVIYYNGTAWGDVPVSVNVNPAIPVTLAGNGLANVRSSLSVNGNTTSSPAGPQFNAAFGLISKHGFGATANQGDNVGLYSGIETWNGSGNTWAVNTVQRLMPSLAAATAGQMFQGYELDIQNDAQDFGVGEVIGPGPATIGLTITGSTQASLNGGVAYKNNAALWITGKAGMWNYGLVFTAAAINQATIYEASALTSTYALALAGSHSWGIDFQGTYSQLTIRGKNNTAILGARNAANSADIGLVKLDASNQLILGEGTTITQVNKGAANYLQLEGATAGNGARILAQGSDTDVALTVVSKGVGAIIFSNSSGFNFQVSSPVGTPANRWAATGSTAGTTPTFSTIGSDTNINGNITLKGTGNLNILNGNGAYAAISDGILNMSKAGSQIQIAGTKVVGARDTGWGAMTGTSDKATAFATASVTLPQLAGRVMAIQAALTTHGLLGP